MMSGKFQERVVPPPADFFTQTATVKEVSVIGIESLDK